MATPQPPKVTPDLLANQAVSQEPRTDEVTCANHPGRKARVFTGNGAYEIPLCDECTPEWFKSAEQAR